MLEIARLCVPPEALPFARLAEKKVTIPTSTTVKALGKGWALAEDARNSHVGGFDTIVLAVGSTPDDRLAMDLRARCQAPDRGCLRRGDPRGLTRRMQPSRSGLPEIGWAITRSRPIIVGDRSATEDTERPLQCPGRSGSRGDRERQTRSPIVGKNRQRGERVGIHRLSRIFRRDATRRS
jgi:hypothetical protein